MIVTQIEDSRSRSLGAPTQRVELIRRGSGPLALAGIGAAAPGRKRERHDMSGAPS
jgi:hypothetical protein